MKKQAIHFLLAMIFAGQVFAQERQANTHESGNDIAVEEDKVWEIVHASNESEGVSNVIIGGKAGMIADRNNEYGEKWERSRNKRTKSFRSAFKGHLNFFEWGQVTLDNVDYTGYSPGRWMEVNRAYELNFNLLKGDFELFPGFNAIGIVAGLGINMNYYHFANGNSIINNNGKTEPVYPAISLQDITKTRLSTYYAQLPLMLEFQIPVSSGSCRRVYFSCGVVVGLLMCSRTLIKYGNTEDKARGNHNINPFKYGYTARIGYRGVSIFATYQESSLFKENAGPAVQQYTIGIGLISL